MHRSKPVAIALDSEFLKSHGRVLTRAVAFVPFSFTKDAAYESQADARAAVPRAPLLSSPQPPPGPRQQTLRRSTIFGIPIILSLIPAEVMRRADVLPCGHSLEAELRTALAHGERLRTIQERHERSSAEAVSEMAGAFNSFCPYSIPNIRRGDVSWFEALYSAAVHSADFREAARRLDHLKAYGKGRRQERSLSFLLRQHPTLLQEVLRESFSSADAWCAWLKMCGDLVERELHRVAEECRHLSAPPASPFTPSVEMESDPSRGGVQYKECGSLEELSYELSRLWCSLRRRGGGGGDMKFYAYGDMDAKAIQNTLRLGCCMQTRCSAPALQRGPPSAPPPLRHNAGQLLASPYEARVVDVTRHTLFAASGFRVSPRTIPRLGDALEKAAAVDGAAARLRSQSDPHNPVWDAKALACVTVASGICLG
ncbi:hypothetical protein TraAM80_09605 [Trypanosoma rangeli]|uniref:Uncharacterized protein n=1 Tax=Trypanosoma rangeli TaxID=5698 RepID=A0A422MUD3_TRYRA|nr:uncharacterized protein TraAM80_09605 [Trypanosoma rangeli]RNE96834.1 hypothetical protein TraAM80_09605 [Trypanosoma rangeli]|eukprot:RNE96834.1 hypothetical protein TraAM80_09605 [Trypanosoma rangeli]